MSERLALAHAIEDAGFERSKVENVATAIAHFIEGVKTDLKATEAAPHAAPASEVARLDTRIERLGANVERIGDRTFRRLGVLVTVAAGTLFAALQLWPPR
jgi:hypothetical protein